MTFVRKSENFVCDHCGQLVEGNGYTDHCPKCLWGKHVDVSPGDRLSTCHGLMKPIGLDKKKGEWKIIYQCQKCHYRFIVRTSPNDDRLEVAKQTNLLLV